MNNINYLKLLVVFVTTFLLSGCTEENIWDSGNTTGGTTDLGSGLVLKSDVLPLLTDGLFIGDPIDPIVIKDADFTLYRADTLGETTLATVDSDNIAISTNSTTVVNAKAAGGIDIIDPLTGIQTAIGSSLTFSTTTDGAKITADGSLVAFVTSSDLIANNSGLFLQIYTLTTDGVTDIVTQVTNFTSSSELASTHLALSGDGTTVFFHSTFDVLNDGSNADGSDELFSINIDGTNLSQITDSATDIGMIIEMETDNSGSSVVLLRDYLLVYNLHTVNTSTGVSVFLSEIKTTGWAVPPDPLIYTIEDQFDISTNGSTIYYVTDDGGLSKIYQVGSAGSNNAMVFNTGATATKGIHASATGTSVTFVTDGEYGMTGSTGKAVYTLTP